MPKGPAEGGGLPQPPFQARHEGFSNINGLAPWVSTGNSIALNPGNILSHLGHECA